MYKHIITDMTESLIADGVIVQEQGDAATASLNRYWHDKIAHIWGIDDVQIRHDLTNEKALEVLQCIHDELDSSIGITWDVLEFWAEELFPGCAKEEDEEDDDLSESWLESFSGCAKGQDDRKDNENDDRYADEKTLV